MTRFVAVIDLGKTNSKIALVDTLTAQEIHVIKQTAAVCEQGLYPSLDHRSIQAFIIDSLACLVSDYGFDAITVTTHGATGALIDNAGELVLPVLDYEFDGVDATRGDYKNLRPHFSSTGSPALPGGLNLGAQLYWQQALFPTQFATATTLLTWPQFWVHSLCGVRGNDLTSLGCHTDLYEPRKHRYSSLVNNKGWGSLMPDVRRSGERCGELSRPILKQLGLKSPVPVYTGIHDSNASLVPHLITQSEPFSVVSTGTWFVVMAIGAGSIVLDETRDTLLNVNAYGDCVPSARFMGGRERDLLGGTTNSTDLSLMDLFGDGCSSAMLMPSQVPGTGPYPNACPQWLGKPVVPGSPIHASAVSLYLALMTNECMKLVGSEGTTFVEGPLAQDKQFAQMLCAVTGRPVMISGAQTGTSVGAAMLVNPPEFQPDYKAVNLSDKFRDKLLRYAKQWQGALQGYAR